jgi:hypothetical protein
MSPEMRPQRRALSTAPLPCRQPVDDHPHPDREGTSLHVDCDACAVRGPACHDCVVTALLGPPPELAFDEEERRALEVLAGSGLVPPLRMVRAVSGPDVTSA